jgi:kynurenine formamidase
MPDRAAFTGTEDAGPGRWQPAEVPSPHPGRPVPVTAARDIPAIRDADRLQSLSICLPRTPETAGLAGTPVTSLPGAGSPPRLPRYLVHIHGGAWRDPRLTSASVEPAVARAFSGGVLPGAGPATVTAIASLNCTVSQVSYPAPPAMANPPVSYDAIKDNHAGLAREAVHPQHVSDALHGCPAALLGLNGLYDLPALATADGLGASHAHLRDAYETLLATAFGTDKDAWPGASPARFGPAIAGRIRDGNAPRLAVLDQSAEDQLVPMNQQDRLTANLSKNRLTKESKVATKYGVRSDSGRAPLRPRISSIAAFVKDNYQRQHRRNPGSPQSPRRDGSVPCRCPRQ